MLVLPQNTANLKNRNTIVKIRIPKIVQVPTSKLQFQKSKFHHQSFYSKNQNSNIKASIPKIKVPTLKLQFQKSKVPSSKLLFQKSKFYHENFNSKNQSSIIKTTIPSIKVPTSKIWKSKAFSSHLHSQKSRLEHWNPYLKNQIPILEPHQTWKFQSFSKYCSCKSYITLGKKQDGTQASKLCHVQLQRLQFAGVHQEQTDPLANDDMRLVINVPDNFFGKHHETLMGTRPLAYSENPELKGSWKY